VTGHNGVRVFIERLRGIIVAREYVMVEYDCPEPQVDAACAVTPGIESPTLAPLSKAGWVAVKAMARRRDVNQIMDDLTDIGAKGIIITDIRTCRI
jgi:ATP phosphoribosyltransferase